MLVFVPVFWRVLPWLVSFLSYRPMFQRWFLWSPPFLMTQPILGSSRPLQTLILMENNCRCHHLNWLIKPFDLHQILLSFWSWPTIPFPLLQFLPLMISSIKSYLQTKLFERWCVQRSDLGKNITITFRYLVWTWPLYKSYTLNHLRLFPWVIQPSKIWIQEGSWEIFPRQFSLISQST